MFTLTYIENLREKVIDKMTENLPEKDREFYKLISALEFKVKLETL